MPTYRLECILLSHDGRAVDKRDFVAVTPDEAIALAKLYESEAPTMGLASAALFSPTGIRIWSLRSESLAWDDIQPTEV